MANQTHEDATASDREIVFSRHFDAPRERVFKAWSEPVHIDAWWGPSGFRNETIEMDFRPGGVWRYIMHGPDGTDYPNRIDYLEMDPPSRLVYVHGDDDDSGSLPFHVTVLFEDRDGGTRITMRCLFDSVEECERVKGFGAVEGGMQTLDRLALYLDAGA